MQDLNQITDAVADRVQELLHTGSVHIVGGYPFEAWVHGRTDWYHVLSQDENVVCTCQRSSYGQATCSHVLAAMVTWHDRDAEGMPF